MFVPRWKSLVSLSNTPNMACWGWETANFTCDFIFAIEKKRPGNTVPESATSQQRRANFTEIKKNTTLNYDDYSESFSSRLIDILMRFQASLVRQLLESRHSQPVSKSEKIRFVEQNIVVETCEWKCELESESNNSEWFVSYCWLLACSLLLFFCTA